MSAKRGHVKKILIKQHYVEIGILCDLAPPTAPECNTTAELKSFHNLQMNSLLDNFKVIGSVIYSSEITRFYRTCVELTFTCNFNSKEWLISYILGSICIDDLTFTKVKFEHSIFIITVLLKFIHQLPSAPLTWAHTLMMKDFTHLYEIVSGITGTERSFKEQVVSVRFLHGFDQLVVLLAVQWNVALAVAPRVLMEKTHIMTLTELW